MMMKSAMRFQLLVVVINSINVVETFILAFCDMHLSYVLGLRGFMVYAICALVRWVYLGLTTGIHTMMLYKCCQREQLSISAVAYICDVLPHRGSCYDAYWHKIPGSFLFSF